MDSKLLVVKTKQILHIFKVTIFFYFCMVFILFFILTFCNNMLYNIKLGMLNDVATSSQIEKTNEEQKTKIRKTERALKVAEVIFTCFIKSL